MGNFLAGFGLELLWSGLKTIVGATIRNSGSHPISRYIANAGKIAAGTEVAKEVGKEAIKGGAIDAAKDIIAPGSEPEGEKDDDEEESPKGIPVQEIPTPSGVSHGNPPPVNITTPDTSSYTPINNTSPYTPINRSYSLFSFNSKSVNDNRLISLLTKLLEVNNLQLNKLTKIANFVTAFDVQKVIANAQSEGNNNTTTTKSSGFSLKNFLSNNRSAFGLDLIDSAKYMAGLAILGHGNAINRGYVVQGKDFGDVQPNPVKGKPSKLSKEELTRRIIWTVDRLKKEGMSEDLAYAYVGQWMRESGLNEKEVGKDGEMGVVQLHKDRLKDFIKQYHKLPTEATYEENIEHAIKDINKRSTSKLIADITAKQGLAKGTIGVERYFEVTKVASEGGFTQSGVDFAFYVKAEYEKHKKEEETNKKELAKEQTKTAEIAKSNEKKRRKLEEITAEKLDLALKSTEDWFKKVKESYIDLAKKSVDKKSIEEDTKKKINESAEKVRILDEKIAALHKKLESKENNENNFDIIQFDKDQLESVKSNVTLSDQIDSLIKKSEKEKNDKKEFDRLKLELNKLELERSKITTSEKLDFFLEDIGFNPSLVVDPLKKRVEDINKSRKERLEKSTEKHEHFSIWGLSKGMFRHFRKPTEEELLSLNENQEEKRQPAKSIVLDRLDALVNGIGTIATFLEKNQGTFDALNTTLSGISNNKQDNSDSNYNTSSTPPTKDKGVEESIPFSN